MRDRPLEAGFLRPPDRNRAGPVLRVDAEVAVLIGKFALRGDPLLPERAARRKIHRRNPALCLSDHEHPLPSSIGVSSFFETPYSI
jgi:hypothetical protein